MRYAEVAVDAPIGPGRTLSYAISPGSDLAPGQMVWVPLGPRPVRGIVFLLTDHPQVDVVKDVLSVVETSPLVTQLGLDLARWVSRYYMASLFDSVALMLPPGFESRVRSFVRMMPEESLTGKLSVETKERWQSVSSGNEMPETDLVRLLGKDGDREVRWLLRRGALTRRWELPRPKASHRYDSFIRSTVLDMRADVRPLQMEKSPRQGALHDALRESPSPVPVSVARKEYGAAAVDGLLGKGLAALEWIRVDREPALQRRSAERGETDLVLTPEQRSALAEVTVAVEGSSCRGRPFLLHGVTGSGKTEVYLRALERCVSMGKKGIYLVPEISLTPQAVHRVNARFPGRVAVLHSGLPLGERFDQWWRIRDGDYDVVVGPRSALFAPLPDLGLIAVDEEHEWTYKQQDATPHYHAREVALKLGELAGAPVVLGSATPDVGSYYRAKEGGYRLLKLPHRVPAGGAGDGHPATMATVEVCDMRSELKDGNRSIFSRALAASLEVCLERGEQAILFLNRRGSATVVQCRECGDALVCRSCAVTLTYHLSGGLSGGLSDGLTDGRLLCHHCNRRTRPPRSCPKCRSPRIRYLGLGTQRVVEELRGLLPGASVLRWDRDAARTPGAHQSIMERFARGEAQVLVGTQMVAKGLHVPNVTLVGVVLADVGLSLPDFRAGERAFQLLCQVAGRAGRGEAAGKVIIQTYSPGNYAVRAAEAQDYGLLYGNEIRSRRQLGNPPFSQLIHLVYMHTSAEASQREAAKMGRVLRHKAYSQGLTEIEVVGPAPGLPERVRGRYRWHLVLRGRNLHFFLEGVAIREGWTVDVDPVSVL